MPFPPLVARAQQSYARRATVGRVPLRPGGERHGPRAAGGLAPDLFVLCPSRLAISGS